MKVIMSGVKVIKVQYGAKRPNLPLAMSADDQTQTHPAVPPMEQVPGILRDYYESFVESISIMAADDQIDSFVVARVGDDLDQYALAVRDVSLVVLVKCIICS